MIQYRAALGPVAVIALFFIGTQWSPFEPHPDPIDPPSSPTGTSSWSDHDWDVFSSVVAGAGEAKLDKLPMGRLMAIIGTSFVGTAYTPNTLDIPGPERLVINFRGLDCVTFVENVHALALAIKSGAAERLDNRADVETEYEQILRTLRYRNGVIDGYPSRLHYFSEWIEENARRQLVTNISKDLGGIIDSEAIDFMSSHPDAYRQLGSLETLKDIQKIERRISERNRHFVPQDLIADIAEHIQDGDIIAATSSVGGLDVAHTGLALWLDDKLHLLHAPLAGESVQISQLTLAERITSIPGQDGIIVARAHELAEPGLRNAALATEH